jgi:hypothetical protein
MDHSLDNFAVQFTAMDMAAVSAALDMSMNESRAHRMFLAFVRAIKDGDSAIDIAWALAQTLNNLITHQVPEKQTDLLRQFITMVVLVRARSAERESMQ